MTNAIKKNQKKLMAIFAVLLMISFVATIGTGRSGASGGRDDVVIAHLGSTPVYQGQMQAAKEEWSFLKSRLPGMQMPVAMDALIFSVYTQIPRPPAMDAQNFQAFMNWENRYGEQIRVAEMVAGSIMQAIDHQSELFYLLQAEAEQNGIRISPMGDEVNEYLRNQLNVDPHELSENSNARQAVRGILLVAGDLRRLMDAVKVSQPSWRHEVARYQSVRLYLADFRTSEFEKSVPAPTTQALEQQFDKYKNFPASQPSETDPLGFGYQIPTRVKLQYVEIPRSQTLYSVVQNIAPPSSNDLAVGAGNPRYLWTVKAAAYYEDHKEDYRNPAPTSRPATTQSASTAPATEPASQPAYKPFAEVKNQIIEKLAADEVDRQIKKIAADVSARLNADYTTIAAANPAATQPTTQPTSAPTLEASASTRPADELMSLAHLELIRAQIEQTFHVAIELHELNADWQTTKDLATLPGIGTATAPDGTPFPEYATRLEGPGSLHVWQPSEPLAGSKQDTFIFRLTAAEPAHAPPSLAPIAQQVEADWRLAQAWDMAKQAATKLYESAKNVGLPQAGRTAGQDVRTTGLFQPARQTPIPGYPLDDATALQKLHAAAADLLKQATPTDSKPDQLIELPSAHRVVVAELAGVQLSAPESLAQVQVTDMEKEARMDRLALGYFDYDKVVERLKYKPEEK